MKLGISTMKLLRKLNEDAAGGSCGGGGEGGATVAAVAMPLFSNMIKRTKPKSKRAVKRMKSIHESEHVHDNSAFDAAHVISKLKSLEKRDETSAKDTTTFGLEDDDQQIVRVSVKTEQADSFEQALQSMLVNQDEQEPLDLAEILFDLKDQFDIVDVVWPDIAEDEEQDMELAGQEGGDMGMEGDPAQGDMGMEGDPMGGEDPMGGDMGMDAGAPMDGGMEDEKSLLTQIIDMMRADAEARKAEAIAKSAEAKAREAAAAHAQILTKVKQEEQFLDMEAHNKQRKEADREAKRLAQLARYKHEVSDEQGDYFGDDEDPAADDVIAAIGVKHKGSDEDEESHLRRPTKTVAQRPNKRVLPADIARFIMARAK
jgi:hypothetical protein